MDTRNTLHTNLKYYRLQKGLSQTEVANRIGVSRQAISNWEAKRAYPDLDNIVLLCKLYGITTDALLGNDTKQQIGETDTTCNSSSESQQDYRILGKTTQNILEMLCLAVILVLASQFIILGILAPILIAVWLRKNDRNYKIMYILCIIIFLIGVRNTYVAIEHVFNIGTATIESV